MIKMKKKVAVAMSGGVDSSVAAALLLCKGFEVVGVTMKLQDEESGAISDAKKVCDILGINHYVADFTKIFRAEVEDYFVAEYLRGRTPNPCVRCNKKIKFGKLFDFAGELGADFLATGHYARVTFENGKHRLKKATDLKKDQSYVLYNLTEEKLSRIILPLGEMSKDEIRARAEELNLPVAKKPDSQEICFVPDDDYKKFLSVRDKNSGALQPGEITDADGKILGHHNGTANYTIGQRKGLGIAAPQPLYVLRSDVKNRRVIVGKSDELFSDELVAEDFHKIHEDELFPEKVFAKIRYGVRVNECSVKPEGKNIRVKFFEPQRAITAGQSVVLYDGDEVIGGGIIM